MNINFIKLASEKGYSVKEGNHLGYPVIILAKDDKIEYVHSIYEGEYFLNKQESV